MNDGALTCLRKRHTAGPRRVFPTTATTPENFPTSPNQTQTVMILREAALIRYLSRPNGADEDACFQMFLHIVSEFVRSGSTFEVRISQRAKAGIMGCVDEAIFKGRDEVRTLEARGRPIRLPPRVGPHCCLRRSQSRLETRLANDQSRQSSTATTANRRISFVSHPRRSSRIYGWISDQNHQTFFFRVWAPGLLCPGCC